MLKIMLCIFFVGLVKCERERYDGYHLLTITPLYDNQHIILHDLLQTNKYITLREPNKRDNSAQIIVPGEDIQNLHNFFQHHSIEYFIENENIQKDLDKTWARLDKKNSFSLDDYNTWEAIEEKIDEWNSNCVQGFTCQIEEIGRSYENRPLRVLKITKPSDQNRKILWFDSTIHAREWLAPATNLKVADAIFSYTNDDAKRLLDKYDFYFLFVVNPDGYIYTWTTSRFWRKSRNANPSGVCVGTDLNRNFANGWGGSGSSGNECSDTYRGSAAGSEPETKALQDKARSLGNRVIAWTSMHTFGNYWLTPFGFTNVLGQCQRPSDHADIIYVAEKTVDAIQATYGTSWLYGPACEVLYAAAGTTPDFTYSVGIKYSSTPELRSGGSGFNPPASAIPLSFNEFWNGIVAMVAAIEEREGI